MRPWLGGGGRVLSSTPSTCRKGQSDLTHCATGRVRWVSLVDPRRSRGGESVASVSSVVGLPPYRTFDMFLAIGEGR